MFRNDDNSEKWSTVATIDSDEDYMDEVISIQLGSTRLDAIEIDSDDSSDTSSTLSADVANLWSIKWILWCRCFLQIY